MNELTTSRSRLFGKNLVYNYQNNHLISFKTRVPIGAGYGLSVDEFDLSTKQLVAIDTTYNCLCDGPNPEQSPFYHAVFAEGNCDIDHTVSPARVSLYILFCLVAFDFIRYGVLTLTRASFLTLTQVIFLFLIYSLLVCGTPQHSN